MTSNAIDMDDDDIYPENDEYVPQEANMQDAEDEEEGEEVESDSDDEIQFITDAKDEPKAESGSQTLKPAARPNERRPSPASTPIPGMSMKRESTPLANINQASTPRSDGRPGTEYPARHTSTLDPENGNPIHPATGKPILQTNLDDDFPNESSKPWRKPGADITDYFNYGFDEFTWASYCLKKQEIPKEIKAINNEADQMKAFFEGMPAGGMPGMPGMSGMPGTSAGPGQNVMDMSSMTGQPDMSQFLDFYKSQGMDPMAMDPAQMSMMMMGANPGQMQMQNQPPTGPAGFDGGHQSGYGGGGGGGGRGRGRRGRGNW